MITSLYLEGFKSFGKPVTIDFRDITLLYGENSSGKSTILQALQYAREVFCNGNLDCLKTEIGGDFVDLRGFDRFVNKRDSNGTVTIGIATNIAVDSNHTDICPIEFRESNEVLKTFTESYLIDDSTRDHLLKLNQSYYFSERDPGSCLLPATQNSKPNLNIDLKVVIGHDVAARSTPSIRGLRLAIEQEPLLVVVSTEDRSPCYEVRLNAAHKILPSSISHACRSIQKQTLQMHLHDFEIQNAEHPEGCDSLDDSPKNSLVIDFDISNYLQSKLKELREAEIKELDNANKSQLEDSTWLSRIKIFAESDWLVCRKPFPARISFPSIVSNPNEIANCLSFQPNVVEAEETDDPDPDSQFVELESYFDKPVQLGDLKDFNLLALYATCSLASATSHFTEILDGLKYVGPLRRHYTVPPQQTSKTDYRCWSDGLGAWDYLGAEPKLITIVNSWLTGKGPFGFDCKIDTTQVLRSKLDELLAASETLHLDTIRQLVADISDTDQVIIKSPDGYRLNSTDVGVGFSQVLPIIVAARGPQPACVLLEQPELHIHVRLQAVLGDLLATGIEAGSAPTKRRQFIVETHSEALLLRLMRRIRETTKEIVNNGPRLLCDHVAIYHISKQDGNSIAKKIELDTYGNLTDEWPDDLFEMSYKERFGE